MSKPEEENTLKYKKYHTNLTYFIDVESSCMLMEYIRSTYTDMGNIIFISFTITAISFKAIIISFFRINILCFDYRYGGGTGFRSPNIIICFETFHRIKNFD